MSDNMELRQLKVAVVRVVTPENRVPRTRLLEMAADEARRRVRQLHCALGGLCGATVEPSQNIIYGNTIDSFTPCCSNPDCPHVREP